MEAIQLITIIGLAITLIVAIVAIIIGSKAKTNASAEISSMESNLSGKISSLVPTTDVKFTWNEDLVDVKGSNYSLAKLMNNQYAFSGTVSLLSGKFTSRVKVPFRIGTIKKADGSKWIGTMKSHVTGSAVTAYNDVYSRTSALVIRSSQTGDDSEELAVYIMQPAYWINPTIYKPTVNMPNNYIYRFDRRTQSYIDNARDAELQGYQRWGTPYNYKGEKLQWVPGVGIQYQDKDNNNVWTNGTYSSTDASTRLRCMPQFFKNTYPVTITEKDASGTVVETKTTREYWHYYVWSFSGDTMGVILLGPQYNVEFTTVGDGKTGFVITKAGQPWRKAYPTSAKTGNLAITNVENSVGSQPGYNFYVYNHEYGWPICHIPILYVNLGNFPSSFPTPTDDPTEGGFSGYAGTAYASTNYLPGVGATKYGIAGPVYNETTASGVLYPGSGLSYDKNTKGTYYYTARGDNRATVMQYEYLTHFDYVGPLALTGFESGYYDAPGVKAAMGGWNAWKGAKEKFA